MLLEARRTEDRLELELGGEWRALEDAQVRAALAAVSFGDARRVSVSTARLAALDLTGAWRLREWVRRAESAGLEVTFTDAAPDQLRLIEATLAGAGDGGAEAPPALPAAERSLALLGRHAVALAADAFAALAFLGRLSVTAVRALGRPRTVRPVSVARHIYDTGVTAIPIVALIAFLISVIIAYMSAEQLKSFGAEIFVVDLVTIGVLRELGVLLTAIIVAGRSASAFAAEIGSMRLDEEVDALEACGVDPFEALVLPRVLGLVIALPLLTVIADLVGIAGGAVLCGYLLHMPLPQYIGRVSQSISSTTFWVGMIKAPVFALLIALAGAHRGMQVRGSSRELGRLTTVAVVQAIFLVILADALFAILFMELGI